VSSSDRSNSSDYENPLTQEQRDLLERVAETEELGDVAERIIENNTFESAPDGGDER
jgi:hypothetical protein